MGALACGETQAVCRRVGSWLLDLRIAAASHFTVWRRSRSEGPLLVDQMGGGGRFEVRPPLTLQASHIKAHAESEVHKVAVQARIAPEAPLTQWIDTTQDSSLLKGSVPHSLSTGFVFGGPSAIQSRFAQWMHCKTQNSSSLRCERLRTG